MNHEPEFVCFCLARRHPNVFMGRRLPSNCRYCNAAMDLNSILPKAQAEAKGLLKMPEEAAPKEEDKTPAPQPQPATPPAQEQRPSPGLSRPLQPAPQQPMQPTGLGMNRPVQPAPQQPMQPMGFGMNRPAQPAQPTGFGLNRPAQPAQPTGFGLNRPVQPAPQQPMQSGFSMGYGAPSHARQSVPAQEWQLDFFGEKIAIPQEGGWIGRSAIGAQWLQGNMLISRQHVKVAPMGDRLQVGPQMSLNGTFITANGEKRPLERNETVTLTAGDILWLYNIPLQVERKSA